jgi:single-stranded-DNA-specific exonuclease
MKIKYYTNTAVDEANLRNLITSEIHPILAQILVNRGIHSLDDLNYSLSSLPHPNTMLGCMDAGIFLANSIINKHKIVIVADYDCDGATSCALAIRGFKLLSSNQNTDVNFVVPDRFIHGYGLTPDIVDLVLYKFPQTQVLITVDNGISSIDGVAYAKQKGLSVIITDHHLSSKELPCADVIVNPNQPNCSFISKNIAGVGVMFYVLMSLRIALRNLNFYAQQNISAPRLDNLLDLVALGTIADVVKLDAVNRCFVHNGITRMRNNKIQAGIASILEVSGKEYRTISSIDLGFAIGPRLNAAGRLEQMDIGINCLINDNPEQTMEMANTLNNLNNERKNIEHDIKDEVSLQLNGEDLHNLEQNAICIYGESWHQGVIGIVASRFKDLYHVPTLIFAKNSEEEDGLIKGSGRSIAGFHMRDAIDYIAKNHPHIITKFGGHAMAAGLTIKQEFFNEFRQAFWSYANSSLNSDQLQKSIYIDAELNAENHNLELAKLIENQVWGQGFANPIFGNSFKILEQKILKEKHLRLKLVLTSSPDKAFNAIWFFNNKPLNIHQNIYVAYEFNINTWMNKQELQLLIRHIFD